MNLDETDALLHDHHHHLHHEITNHGKELQPQLQQTHQEQPFSLPSIPEIMVFRDEEDEDKDEEKVVGLSPSSSDADDANHNTTATVVAASTGVVHSNMHQHPSTYINPEPHIFTQLYTFNCESHALKVHCIANALVFLPPSTDRP
uniref:Uncharacterized protein n=1 Tax=Nelumbo nucifera TaxID=4432 RepID=A0A822XP34_NELNU|nr:TPA_asm: hypothetical protein HUJ06_021978 [Nelumbo nucifera]